MMRVGRFVGVFEAVDCGLQFFCDRLLVFEVVLNCDAELVLPVCGRCACQVDTIVRPEQRRT